uniref:Transmembrane protein n=1 Tax=Syphacia muris TaxID=451379 RepID=A0A0N5AFN5_9BILA
MRDLMVLNEKKGANILEYLVRACFASVEVRAVLLVAFAGVDGDCELLAANSWGSFSELVSTGVGESCCSSALQGKLKIVPSAESCILQVRLLLFDYDYDMSAVLFSVFGVNPVLLIQERGIAVQRSLLSFTRVFFLLSRFFRFFELVVRGYGFFFLEQKSVSKFGMGDCWFQSSWAFEIERRFSPVISVVVLDGFCEGLWIQVYWRIRRDRRVSCHYIWNSILAQFMSC